MNFLSIVVGVLYPRSRSFEGGRRYNIVEKPYVILYTYYKLGLDLNYGILCCSLKPEHDERDQGEERIAQNKRARAGSLVITYLISHK